MFTPPTPSSPRGDKKNALLAGYLAFVAGFVNSGGYVLIGSFTSHVTGTIGRIGNDLAGRRIGSAGGAAMLVLFFFAGALLANLIIDGVREEQRGRAYGTALGLEGALLLLFIFVAGTSQATDLRVRDLEAALLCVAMGMQNSLFTRMSGAVIRTTHLTGVVTDLGIEAARWIHWYRDRAREVPPLIKSILLVTIAGAFTAGAVLGALMTTHLSRWSMLFPALAMGLAATASFRSGKKATVPAALHSSSAQNGST